MIKYKGTTLYPPAMNDLLNSFGDITAHLIEISTNELGTDEIVIKVASVNTSEVFLSQIKDHFRAKLRVTPKIVFVPADELNRLMFTPMSRKPITFIDKR